MIASQIPSRAFAAAKGLLNWWFKELNGLFAPALARWERPHIEASASARQIELVTVSASRKRLQTESPIVLNDSLCDAPRGHQRQLPVWLIPAKQDVLSRVIELPKSMAARCDSLIRLEAERWTAFPATDIVHGWGSPRPIDKSRVAIELRFVMRSEISKLAAALQGRGLAPSLIVLGDGIRVPWHQEKTAKGALLGTGTLVASALALLILLGATDWIAARRAVDVWQARVTEQSALLKRQKELEARVTAVSASNLAAQARRSDSKSALLSTLATVFPKTDWLTELSIKEGVLTLRGYASNVENLIRILEPLAADRIVTVQGDLAFDSKLSRQRFTLVLRRPGGRHD